MIRHIEQSKVYTNEAIAEALGFPPGASGVKILFDLKKRISLPIHHEPGKQRVFMYQDAICEFRFQILRDKQSIADYLGISLRSLGSLMKQPGFPAYRISKEEVGHVSFFALKDSTAVWYKDYRLGAFVQTGDIRHWNIAKRGLAKIPCGTCGKPKFLIPGLTVTEVPPAEYFTCSNLEDSYTLQIRDENPACPFCDKPVHPFTCYHPFLHV
jgi:hypothetical protein